jgi:hypothetical protein
MRASVVSQAIDQVIERYHDKRAILRKMPKGITCLGCPYWDDVDVKCRAVSCDAEKQEPDWQKIAEEEKQYIANVKFYFSSQ